MGNLKLTSQNKITAALVIANVFVLSLYTSGWSPNRPGTSLSQGNQRSVQREEVLKTEPIEITAVKVKNKAFRPGETFEEGDEWLKDLNLTVRNKSDKAITYIALNVTFPETKNAQSMVIHSLFLGQRPDQTSTLANPPLRLEPDESIDVSLAPHYEAIRTLIDSQQPPAGNIHTTRVLLGQALFEDGTLYYGGKIYKRNPDPASPRKWVRAADEQANPHN